MIQKKHQANNLTVVALKEKIKMKRKPLILKEHIRTKKKLIDLILKMITEEKRKRLGVILKMVTEKKRKKLGVIPKMIIEEKRNLVKRSLKKNLSTKGEMKVVTLRNLIEGKRRIVILIQNKKENLSDVIEDITVLVVRKI